MLFIKNIAKAPVLKKELTKVLPLAINNHQQNRGYAGHKIPDRLEHIPTALNPKFFDMLSTPLNTYKFNICAPLTIPFIIDFLELSNYFPLGGIFFPSRLPSGRRFSR